METCYVCSFKTKDIYQITIGRHKVVWVCNGCSDEYLHRKYESELQILKGLKDAKDPFYVPLKDSEATYRCGKCNARFFLQE